MCQKLVYIKVDEMLTMTINIFDKKNDKREWIVNKK